MVHMTATVSSPKIGIGPKKLGFKCGCVIFGKALAKLRRIEPAKVAVAGVKTVLR